MKDKILPILVIVTAVLALINLATLDIVWLRALRQEEAIIGGEPISLPLFASPTPAVSTLETPASAVTDACGPVCQQTIAERVAEAMATVSGETAVQEKTVVKETTSGAFQPQVIYVPLGGGGSTTNRDWADVGNAEVYLNIDDYTHVDKVYFEGFIKVKHGNGKTFARLYDVTHSIGVQGGEIATTSESYTLVESGSLSLWRGKNLYRVQIKSLNGYEASFDTGRIKIIIK